MSAIHQAVLASYAPAGGATPFGGAVSTTDLVEWWPLSESSGTRVGVHAGLNLTDNNTVTGGDDGVPYSQFTAANSETLSSTDTAFATGDIDFSITGWFYPDSIDASGKDIIGRNTFSEWMVEIYSSGGNNFRWRVGSGTGDLINVEAGMAIAGWNFFCVWHDSVANEIGYQLGSTTRTQAHSTGVGTVASPLVLGEAVPGRYFDGRMRRFGIWKRVLSAGDRTALLNSGNGLDY